jgi:toxin ParE1/3/4
VKAKRVERTISYRDDLDAVEAYIAKDNPRAALEVWLLIDEQVDQLADPNFPRRKGRVPGTFELVAHENYIVILIEDATTVTAINVVHARQRWPA